MSPAVEMPSFRQTQTTFTQWLRDPERPPPADVPRERLATYAELVHNNIRGFLESSLPILRARTDAAVWDHWVKRFIADHPCQSPLFRDIPLAFVEFMSNGALAVPAELPFAVELAHYEWTEIALFLAADSPPPPFAPNGDLMAQPPVLNPVLWLLAYQYPVQRISARPQPEDTITGPYFLLRYRDRQDEVRTFEIDRLMARLVQVLQEQPQLAGDALARQLAAEMQQAAPRELAGEVAQRLDQLQREGIVLGALIQE